MASNRYLWYTNLSLATLVRLANLKIVLFWSYTPYMPNLGSLSHSHGLEEVPVVHQPGPEHLGEVD